MATVGPTFRSGVPDSGGPPVSVDCARPEGRAYGRLIRGVDAILAVLLAPTCASCDRPLDNPTRGPVCAACWSAIVPITPPVCDACGDPLPSWRRISQAESRCPRCRRHRQVVRTRAIGAYDGVLGRIVHALKYDGRRRVARPLAALLARVGAELLAGADVVVPVPLHRSRLAARGFNQAAEIARHLGVPMAHGLRRVRPTRSQTDLPAARRHANVRGAFAVARRFDPRGLVVVLVDDVSTTGATLGGCAEPLLAAGASEVRALTAARVVTRRR
jgi:ComF family protein